MLKMNENNKAELFGKITKPLEYDYTYHRRKYYRTEITVQRLSDTVDRIPIILDGFRDCYGKTVRVVGEFQSRNEVYDGKTHLKLFVFAHELEILDYDANINELFLNGFICKVPNYRVTSVNEIEICDLLIAVNRSYSRKVDYIPTIVWGRNADVASKLDVGTNVHLYGRIQSREYTKITDDGTLMKTAYEFSVGRMEVSYE